MRVMAIALVALCIAGVGLAQEAVPPETAPPEAVSPEAVSPEGRPQFFAWEPSDQALRRVYPERAMTRGVAGVVHLCCTANASRDIACEVAVEWPRGQGFGDASLLLVRGRRLTEQAFADLQSVPGATFRVPVRWQVLPPPPELDGVVARIDSETMDLCGPGTGGTPDYVVVEGQRVFVR